jgi:hypothetical protein
MPTTTTTTTTSIIVFFLQILVNHHNCSGSAIHELSAAQEDQCLRQQQQQHQLLCFFSKYLLIITTVLEVQYICSQLPKKTNAYNNNINDCVFLQLLVNHLNCSGSAIHVHSAAQELTCIKWPTSQQANNLLIRTSV